VSTALAIRVVYTCHRCGFDFDHERGSTRGARRHTCDECRGVIKRELNARNYARLAAARDDAQTTVLLPDGHPAYPLLARFVDHQCGVRLALACLRTGRIAEAERALIELEGGAS
jgi:DNA-directed RNA polymerase subunit RPC12/RpoP